MATVTKTFVFASNAEGFTDAGVSARGFSYTGSQGSPSTGCVGFSSGENLTEIGRTGAGNSWEALFGVPASSTVTDVQVTAWKRFIDLANFISNNTAATLKMRVVNASNTTVHSAGELISETFSTTSPWTAGSAGTSRAVDASYQASTTNVKMEFESNGGSGNWDDGDNSGTLDYGVYVDTVEVTVTYASATSFTPKTIMF